MPMPTDGNAVKIIFSRRTCLFLGLIAIKGLAGSKTAFRSLSLQLQGEFYGEKIK